MNPTTNTVTMTSPWSARFYLALAAGHSLKHIKVNIMKSTFSLLLLGLLASLVFLPSAEAHTFGAHGAGFAEGLAHPFSGLDHLLAMVAVGLWASRVAGRFAWQAPLAFITVMAVAAGLGMAGVELPLPEPAIAGSVLALGLLLTFTVRIGVSTGLALVGLFAFFHGYAHGLELPATATPVFYALGFVTATAMLHGIGLGLGWTARRTDWVVRLCGSMIALTGLYLLAAA